ncbi:hypothetical protein ACS0TY_034092 [Phlomoides rotata]
MKYVIFEDGLQKGEVYKHPPLQTSIERLSQLKAVEDKTMRLMSGGSATVSGGKKEWSKFLMALSKSEIEEDFYSMVGHRRP